MHPDLKYYECHQEDLCSGKYRYNTIDSFRKHRISKHRSEFPIECHESYSFEEMDVDPPPNEDSTLISRLIASSSNNDFHNKSKKSFEKLLDLDLLMTFSELYGFTDLPRKRVQDIIDVFSKNILQGKSFEFLQESISKTISESNVAPEINKSLELFSHAFEQYPSEYKQIKFLSEFGKFVEPQSYKIGERKDYQEKGGVRVEVAVDLEAQFISLRKTLESFFQLDNVLPQTLFHLDQLFKLADENPNVISNFVQGDYWKGLNYTKDKRRLTIPLVVYFDEFEVNNPLGSHAGVNKLGGIYCSIPVLPIEFQARIENIFEVILFNTLDRKMTQDSFILSKLTEEIKFLETTGITFEKYDVTLYFKLALVVGDNLGIHSLLGFVESFSANFPCRFCSINKMDLGNIFDENECNLRTKENYDESLKQNDSSKTGIKTESVFNSLDNFHIIDALCVDAMHDILEGVSKYDLGSILHNYVYEKQYLSLDKLNKCINSYAYDSNDKLSKPPCIDENHLKKKRSLSLLLKCIALCRT
jgi:hypothetical protein